MRKQTGFTLIEIAIVLVIIGLLLGGVLKGQELITAARVRNLASQLDGVKIAYFGFLDRFRVAPGDMLLANATNSIPGNPSGCAFGPNCGNGRIDPEEIYVVWNQLSRAGFITGSYNGTPADAAPTAANTPTNPYGGYLQLITDAAYGDVAAPPAAVLNIKTGALIPSGVIAELDRKIDDGLPLTGSFRSSAFNGAADCNTVAPVQWNAAGDIKNCGGAAIQ